MSDERNAKAPILKAVEVYKAYGKAHTRVEVLRGINMELADGEMLAVVGASGAGKSTLLHVLGALDAPDSGEVLYRNESISKMWNGRRDLVRNRIFGFVFQFYHLLGEFTALENVLMPELIRRGVFAWPAVRSEARKAAADLLEQFGLGNRLTHRPSELSGGEQQRVALARALIGRPEILLCDEPTGNLDSKTGKEIIDMLLELNRQGQSMVVVTHDRGLAALAHREATLADGKIHAVRREHSAKGAV
jgi:lipoprotein-releasing system ATP-binding protein